jgi:hypothetical protein
MKNQHNNPLPIRPRPPILGSYVPNSGSVPMKSTTPNYGSNRSSHLQPLSLWYPRPPSCSLTGDLVPPRHGASAASGCRGVRDPSSGQIAWVHVQQSARMIPEPHHRLEDLQMQPSPSAGHRNHCLEDLHIQPSARTHHHHHHREDSRMPPQVLFLPEVQYHESALQDRRYRVPDARTLVQL